MPGRIIENGRGMDNSIQKVLVFDDGKELEFAEDSKELWLHTWHCEGHGREALAIMERYANKKNLNIIVPTVLNGKLMKILTDNNFKPETRYEPIIRENLELMVKGR
ncbi:MAG: hypothetical protein DRN81_02160 [Thermoproteota archaeon]|nr:MAG: hypothetical protein DRN81_02160 [Candidatus Korarchaeota archaeon]